MCSVRFSQFGGDVLGVVITRTRIPAGKTVALKTVGILSAMACSGLHIPCEDADIVLTMVFLGYW